MRPATKLLLYFPAFATFYWCEDLAIAETIIAAHWGVMGEVSDVGGRVLVRQACHDPATIDAAREACHRLGFLHCRS